MDAPLDDVVFVPLHAPPAVQDVELVEFHERFEEVL
jgi:hypothetical protein